MTANGEGSGASAGPVHPAADPLLYVHWGAFSGSAPSLAAALAERVPLSTIDLMPLARDPRLLGARVRAMAEARAEGRCVPWSKTRSWSAGLQRRMERELVRRDDPVLFVQSLPALELPPTVRYAVYTDRTGLEGRREPPPFTSRFGRRWLPRERAFLSGAQMVFAMGPSTAASLREDYGIPAERVRVVGAGANMSLGLPRPRTEARRLIFVGVEWERKGGPALLEAFARARAELPELELMIVGTRPDGPLPDGVEVVGRVPHARLDALYDSADVLVHPAVKEAFGIALVEALIKGLPCVHTPVSNLPWIVGDAGVAVPVGDPAGIAGGIRKVVADYPTYHALALERGRELQRSMTWPAVADQILTGWPALR